MKHLLLFAFLAITNFTTTAPKHDFHVSVTLAEWKPANGNLEMHIKLFSDDLAFALENNKQVQQDLGTYLSEHFYLKVKGERINLKFIGTEVENELTYAYLETPDFKPYENILVVNTLFMEVFDDQSNIVNLTIDKELHSAFLTKNHQSQMLSYNTL